MYMYMYTCKPMSCIYSMSCIYLYMCTSSQSLSRQYLAVVSYGDDSATVKFHRRYEL